METQKIAVYGTLKRGYGNNQLLKGATFLGETRTKPEFTMYGKTIPYVSRGGTTPIKVEVYEVDVYTLRNTDRLEGHPYFYCRELVETEFGEAWMYMISGRYIGEEFKITSGEWHGSRYFFQGI